MKRSIFCYMVLIIFLFTLLPVSNLKAGSEKTFTAKDLLSLRGCSDAKINPDGSWIAYTVFTPQKADEKPGISPRELFLISPATGKVKPFITGKVSIRGLEWSPDGKKLAFLTRKGEKAKSQVWIIPVDGGEAVQATFSKTGVGRYKWHPTQNKIIYISKEPKPEKDKKLDEKGYGFIFYEEKLRHNNLYSQQIGSKKEKPKQLTKGVTILDFALSSDGKQIAVKSIKKNLIDYSYMFSRIYLLDLATGKLDKVSRNEGKLGNFQFSPNGLKLAYAASFDRKDHAVSQAYVVDLKTREVKNLTIPDFKGHVNGVTWKDDKTIVYTSGEGVWPTVSQVPAVGGKRTIMLNSKSSGVIFRSISYSKNFKYAAFVGSTSEDPSQLYYWQVGKKPSRKVKKPLKALTNYNPWLKTKQLGKQEVIRYNARDGLEVEGILIYPVAYKKGQRYPLVVLVHGGPEAHYSNGWITRYAEPGQVLAGKGYAVFYPNYRASTGYGVKFALQGYKDPAGKEFDDLADGIDHLVKTGLADRDRVGLGGGSYGGYAAAWFGTYYTKYVRAVCMFVGISDLISKVGTTDIPKEEVYVHSGEVLEKSWQKKLKRSPIYYAHQSKSAVLIFGGAADPRVHPGQSLELYRRLKMNDHPATRLVQYPGEGHGNRKHPGRIDVLYRIMQWYDWYVKDKKPLKGPMPDVDISDLYGLKLK